MSHNRRPSGVPPTAAISLHRRELALGAMKRHSLPRNIYQFSRLFDDLVGDAQHAGRHREANRLRGPEVDQELEPGRPLDRQVGGLLALEDTTGIDANLTPRVFEAWPISHQPAGLDEIVPVGSVGRVGA